MLKKIAVVLLALIMLTLAGCGKAEKPKVTGDDKEPAVTEQPVEAVNPLTGEKGLAEGKQYDRPVAIMVNNISTAQPVQTGVREADIVYETEVEGGITRLMAVFQDISKVSQIGSVRSARYVYVDLALGHNAMYIHCGQDPNYCAPHLKDIDDLSIDTNSKGAKRIKNGLASEHTLYAFGAELWENVKSNFKTEAKNTGAWQKFAEEDAVVTPEGGAASKVNLPFTNAYKTEFTYDSEAKTYIRSVKGTVRKDYKTGETTAITNLLILKTSITNYPIEKYRKVALEGGSGYYITNGAYQPIKWSKGAAKNGFTFTDEAGAPLTLNVGKSWVCIVDDDIAPTFE